LFHAAKGTILTEVPQAANKPKTQFQFIISVFNHTVMYMNICRTCGKPTANSQITT